MSSLQDKITERIRAQGPRRWAEVMQAALYDEEFGYYSRGARIGRRGADFLTASELHPLFGRTIGAVAGELLSRFGGDTVLEVGAGTGALAAEILRGFRLAGHSPHPLAQYIISEISAAMENEQRRRLTEFKGLAEWESLDDCQPFTGVVLAVELFDALPVRRVKWRGEQLLEEHIDVAGGELKSVWLKCSNEQILQHAREIPIPRAEDQIIEVNLAARRMLERISRVLRQGCLLVFDYGDLTEHLFNTDHAAGTLRRFSGHAVDNNYLSDLGEADLTASVDFGSMHRWAASCGFQLAEFGEQSRWLMRHGIVDAAAAMEHEARNIAEKIRVREALKELTLPGRISQNFKVALYEKRGEP